MSAQNGRASRVGFSLGQALTHSMHSPQKLLRSSRPGLTSQGQPQPSSLPATQERRRHSSQSFGSRTRTSAIAVIA